MAYTSVMQTCGRAKMVNETLKLYEYMVKAGIELDDVAQSTVLDACCRVGQWEKAVSILRGMSEPSQLAYNSVIHGCGKNDKWEQAVELLQEMKSRGLRPDEVTYTSVVNSCSNCGQLDLSIRLLQEMREEMGLEPNVVAYYSAVKGCRALRDWKRALSLVHDMETAGVPPVAAVYHHAIESCLVANQPEEASALLDRMHEGGFPPVPNYYDHALTSMLSNLPEEWHKALTLLERSLNRVCVLPFKTYERVLDACGKKARWSTVMALLDRATEGPISVAQLAYPLVLYVCSKTGDWRRGVMTMREMTARGCRPLDVNDYTWIVSACGLAGRWREAQVLLWEAHRRGLRLNVDGFITGSMQTGNMRAAVEIVLDVKERLRVDPGRSAWTAALKAARILKDHTMSAHVIRAMGDQAKKEDYDMVIQTCAIGGDWEAIMRSVSEMKEHGLHPDAVHFNQAINAVSHGDKPSEKAIGLLRVMKEKFGVVPDIVTYTSVINACGASGDWQQALRLLEELEENGLSANNITYSSVIRACGRAGRWDKALTTFHRMREQELQPDLVTYNNVLNACAQAAKVDQALELLGQMDNHVNGRIRPDVVSYTAVIKACERSGRWSSSLEVLRRMIANGLSPDIMTYNAVLRVCARKGRWEEVLALLTDIVRRNLQTDEWTDRAMASGKKGDGAVSIARVKSLTLAQSLKAERGSRTGTSSRRRRIHQQR